MNKILFSGFRQKHFFLSFIMFLFYQVSLSQTDTTLLFKLLQDAPNDSVRIEVYLQLGDYFQSKVPDRAIQYFDNVLELTNRYAGEFYTFNSAMCYNRKGIIYTIQGAFVKSLENYQKAEKAFDELIQIDPDNEDYKHGKINILANIGTIYYHQENYKKAIKYWEETLEVIRELGIEFAEAQLLNNIGVIYKDTEEFARALEYLNKALEIFLKVDSPKDVAMCYTNLGEIYDELDLPSKSLEYLLKSLEIKEQQDDKHGLAQCLGSIARLYYNIGEYRQSIAYAKRSLEIATQIKNNKDICIAYETLANNYAAIQDYKNAYEMHLLYSRINDSIFNNESHNKFVELQSKYETEKQENELKILHQKEEHQAVLRNILIGGILLILVFSGLLIRSIIIKRKKERTIYEKDKILHQQEKLLMNTELEKKELKSQELNKEIEYKTKQLTTYALNIMQKNKMLMELIKDIDQVSKNATADLKNDLKRLKLQVKQNLKTDKDWDVFKMYFEQINKGFFNKLEDVNSSLNIYDLRHCALIKLNLNIKETASVLNLSPNSIKSARYRLKKKLNLEPDDELYEFIKNL